MKTISRSNANCNYAVSLTFDNCSKSLIKQIENKIKIDQATECWNWTASRTPQGYGYIRIKKKTLQAHRVMYAIAVGPIPAGVWVLHVCDNPCCVNPKHLFLGSRHDNIDDMVRKNRHFKPRGESHPRAKLTLEQVEDIRRRAMTGTRGNKFGNQGDLAREFNVTRQAIVAIVHKHSWNS